MATLTLPKRQPILLRDFVVAAPRALGLPREYRFYVYNDRTETAEALHLALMLTPSELKRLAPEDTVAAATRAFKAACSSTPGCEDWTVYLEGQDLDGRPGTVDGRCTVSTLHLRSALAQVIHEHGLDAVKAAVGALRFVPASREAELECEPLAPWVEELIDDEDGRGYFPGQLL